jgi:hypothetical protein
MIYEELVNLGHRPVYFIYGAPIPSNVDIVLTHGPYGKLLPVWQQAAQFSSINRSSVVHWNTEGYPDLRLPPLVMWTLGAYRSRLGRLNHSNHAWLRQLASKPPISWLDGRMLRFRHIGDYEYAYRKGWLDVLADSSQIYAQLNNRHGIPTLHIPWGPTPAVYADLGLKRDIDVLWMGNRATRRRSKLLDRIRQELNAYGIALYVADNEENPFIFGETRTRFLNRAKITLNLTRTWYDDNFSRFAYATANRSLVVSEPLLSHCSDYEVGIHYISAPINKLAQTIVHYLIHDDERQAIVENAYQLVTTKLAFRNSISRLIDAAITKYKTVEILGDDELRGNCANKLFISDPRC